MAKKASNISDILRTVAGPEHSERPKRSQRKLKELPKPVPKPLEDGTPSAKRVVRDFSR